MRNSILALIAVAPLLLGCGGNSLNNPLLSPETDTGETEGTVTATTPIEIPADLQFNLKSAQLVTDVNGVQTLQVQTAAFAGSPNETWVRVPTLDTSGFLAFRKQDNAFDRLFVGLADSSADGSSRAAVVADGGQFNRVFTGAIYERSGGYTPPPTTGANAITGNVAYTGRYVGLLNGGAVTGDALPIPRPATQSEIPGEASRVTGNVILIADFYNNAVNGSLRDRRAIDLQVTQDVNSPLYNDGTGVRLEEVVMPFDTDEGKILANGTFTGKLERPTNKDATRATVGQYGGVIGGTDASSISGAISLTSIHNQDGDQIEGALERGVFVLDKCLPTSGGDCVGTGP